MEHVLTRTRAAVRAFSLPYLQAYFERLHEFSNWVIVSDYSIGSVGEPNDVAAFTVMPRVGSLVELDREVGICLRGDLKQVRGISDLAIGCLRCDLFYTFAFVMPRERCLFSQQKPEAEAAAQLAAVRGTLEYYEGTLQGELQNSELVKALVRKLRLLEPRVRNRSANLKLLRDISLVPSLAACIVSIVQEFAAAAEVGWLSDRDNIVRAYDELAYEIFVLSHSWLAEQRGQNGKNTHLVFANPPDVKGKRIWYDSLVRIPDYVAGALANYDLIEDSITRLKVERIITECLRDRRHFAMHKLDLGPSEKFSCRGFEFHKKK